MSNAASFFHTSFFKQKSATQSAAATVYFLKLFLAATGPMYFVFCRLYPFNPQPPRQCLGTTCVISLLLNNTVSPDAGLPNHMLGEVSWGPTISAFRGRIQRKTWCMGPYTEVDFNLPYTHSSPESTPTHLPESSLTLCQRDFGFGLSL
jgi:hypothetical protein